MPTDGAARRQPLGCGAWGAGIRAGAGVSISIAITVALPCSAAGGALCRSPPPLAKRGTARCACVGERFRACRVMRRGVDVHQSLMLLLAGLPARMAVRHKRCPSQSCIVGRSVLEALKGLWDKLQPVCGASRFRRHVLWLWPVASIGALGAWGARTCFAPKPCPFFSLFDALLLGSHSFMSASIPFGRLAAQAAGSRCCCHPAPRAGLPIMMMGGGCRIMQKRTNNISTPLMPCLGNWCTCFEPYYIFHVSASSQRIGTYSCVCLPASARALRGVLRPGVARWPYVMTHGCSCLGSR